METPEVRNPFALLIDPDQVVKAVESSERLGRLHSRICRPLDRTGDHSGNGARGDDDSEMGDLGGAGGPVTQV